MICFGVSNPVFINGERRLCQSILWLESIASSYSPNKLNLSIKNESNNSSAYLCVTG